MSAAKKSKAVETATNKPSKRSGKDRSSKPEDVAPAIEASAQDGKAPGVIASIFEVLTAATEENPVTKDAICAELARRFPERATESMMRTINVQVPGRITKERGVKVRKNESGYYIER